MRVCLLGEDRECFLCRNHCPYEAITLVWSETDYMLTPKIDLQKCPGCGACEVVCPTSPGKAIVVHPFTQ
jgi:formate hydrogenlyase subunit 6/NADH:ubiquinone oxidoreductase subunit I